MEVRVNSVKHVTSEKNEHLMGFASVTIDNLFTIKDIAIVEHDKDRFISMPSYSTKDGEYHDFINFSNDEVGKATRKELTKAIVNAYDQVQQGQTLEVPELNHEKATENSSNVSVFVKENKFVSLTYNGMYFNGTRLVEGQNGLFMSMPSQKAYEDEQGKPVYMDKFYIPDEKARISIQTKAIENYNHYFNNQEQESEEDEEER